MREAYDVEDTTTEAAQFSDHPSCLNIDHPNDHVVAYDSQ